MIINQIWIGKLEPTPVDLSQLTNVVKNDVVKRLHMIEKVNTIQDTDTSDLVKKLIQRKIVEIKKKYLAMVHALLLLNLLS